MARPYRPERPRGRVRRWFGRTIGLLVTLALVAAGTLFVAHFLAIQRTADEVRATALLPTDSPARVLVVLARPSQELTMAGTLAELDDAGASVSLLSLTAGEAQLPAVTFAGDKLDEIRADELAHAADLLGVDSVTNAELADGSLLASEPDEVTATIAKTIAEQTPSIILTVSDQTGQDRDSQAVAAYALAAAQAEGSGVARVWTVTRGDRELSWNAQLGHPVATAVPEPQVAVRIDDQTATKGEVLLAHGTQSPDLAESTYPFADAIPA